MDIVYIFKEGPLDSLELRYSLRSLCKNVKFNNVYIIEDKPRWLQDVTHIKIKNSTTNKYYNITYKIKQTINIKELSDDFVIMWDDIFILSPISEFKHYSDGLTLKEVVGVKKRYSTHNNTFKYVLNIYSDGINYDVHSPYLYNKENLKRLFKEHRLDIKKIYSLRSMYGNFYKLEYELVKNCKINTYENFVMLKNCNKFASSNKTILGDKRFIDYMETNFEKCKYEK